MGAVVVVERFPFLEFPVQVYIILVCQQLIKLLLVGSVRPFHLAVELRGPRFDVNMPDSSVLDMPMKEGLELMTSIRADCVDAKGELVDDIVDELDRVVLIVTVVDLERPDSSCVIDGSVLKATHSMPSWSLETHNLHVCLNMMTRDLLGVSVGVDSSSPHMARKPTDPVPCQSSVYARIRGRDAMVTCQIPDNPLRTKTTRFPQLKDLLNSLGGKRPRMMIGDWLLRNKSRRAMFPEGFPPNIED
jgi:hypothetical protein